MRARHELRQGSQQRFPELFPSPDPNRRWPVRDLPRRPCGRGPGQSGPGRSRSRTREYAWLTDCRSRTARGFSRLPSRQGDLGMSRMRREAPRLPRRDASKGPGDGDRSGAAPAGPPTLEPDQTRGEAARRPGAAGHATPTVGSAGSAPEWSEATGSGSGRPAGPGLTSGYRAERRSDTNSRRHQFPPPTPTVPLRLELSATGLYYKQQGSAGKSRGGICRRCIST